MSARSLAETLLKVFGVLFMVMACCADCADKAMLHAGRAGIRLKSLSEATVRLKLVRA
jgi:hypothetical protein